LVLVLSGLYMYIGLLSLLDRRVWKRPSDGVNWTQTQRGVEVESVRTPQPTALGDLAEGDRLVSINGIGIQGLDEYTEIIELLLKTSPPATQVTYLVEKAGSGARVSYAVEIQLSLGTDFTDLLLGVLALAYLGIGVFTFLPNWKAQGAFHFYLICLVAFVLFVYRYSGRADTFDVFIYWCSATAFLLLPPLFLHFCCNFPQPVSFLRNSPALSSLLYLPALCLVGLHGLWFLGSLQQLGLPRVERLAYLFDRVHLAHFVTLFLLGSVVLVYSSREGASFIHRLQMKWVTWGTLLGILPFVCFYALLSTLIRPECSWMMP